MKEVTKRLWGLFLLASSHTGLGQQTTHLEHSYCSRAQALFNAQQNPMQTFTNLIVLLNTNSMTSLSEIGQLGKKHYPELSPVNAASAMIIDSLFSLSEPAQQVFLNQSRLFCRAFLQASPTPHEKFLTVCRPLGKTITSTRHCLPISCNALLFPETSFQLFIRYLHSIINTIPSSLRTAMPHFSTCLNLSAAQRNSLDKLQWENFLKLPSGNQFEIGYPGSADSTELNDPLMVAHLLNDEPEQLTAANGCHAISIKTTPENTSLSVSVQCHAAPSEFSYSNNGQFHTLTKSFDFYSLLSGFVTLLALSATCWYFWAQGLKKPKPINLETKNTHTQDPEQKKLLAEKQKALSTAQRELAQSRNESEELKKKIEELNLKIKLLENIPLKKLAELYKVAVSIFSWRFKGDKNICLDNFHLMLHRLIELLEKFDLEPFNDFVNPPELTYKIDLNHWNNLLARTVYAHKTISPKITEELSQYYFIPSNFPTEIYQQLRELAESLGKKYQVFIQGSSLWNYEKSSDIDIVVHYSEGAYPENDFRSLLISCFTGSTITYHQPKIEGMHSYKITLPNSRVIDLCYTPDTTPESLPLFTSAEGRLILDGRSGVERSAGFAEFLLTNQTQFSSEQAREAVTSALNKLENDSADQDAINMISYALNHLAKAPARGYSLCDEIREIFSTVPLLPANSYAALCTQIRTRYSTNASTIFAFINSLRKTAPTMRR